MDLDRMLEKCHRDQWSADELDWSVTPRPMSREQEMAIVQYFTDMASIERLAGALFQEQYRRVEDPRLKEIFQTFVEDEIRHSQVAQRLADHYDVHHYRLYVQNPALSRFAPCFYDAIQYLSAEVANAYITGGELILDVALLRSLNDYVDDPMSQQAMDLINRDESRHIAIDFYMTQLYASSEHRAQAVPTPRTTLADRFKAARAFAGIIYYGKPFFDDVFFGPMKRTDPSGVRLKEAMKRMQLLRLKDGVREHPFNQFLLKMQDLYQHPVLRKTLGPVLLYVAGTDETIMQKLYDEQELARAQQQSFDDLAQEALSLKYAN